MAEGSHDERFTAAHRGPANPRNWRYQDCGAAFLKCELSDVARRDPDTQLTARQVVLEDCALFIANPARFVFSVNKTLIEAHFH